MEQECNVEIMTEVEEESSSENEEIAGGSSRLGFGLLFGYACATLGALAYKGVKIVRSKLKERKQRGFVEVKSVDPTEGIDVSIEDCSDIENG